MSDKLSSPSSSSGYSPRQRGIGNGDETYLVVRHHPPTYVFSNESFAVDIQLEIPKSSTPPTPPPQDIELVASLHHVKNGRECTSEAILITEPSRIMLSQESKSCTVKCMIRMDGIRRDQGANLELRFAPRADLGSPTTQSILGASTKAITIVNYKVKISLEDDWDQIWYKDEGGRDKSMEIFVAIYDKDGQVRTGEQIPLHPLLCYATEDGTPTKVTNQEILRTLGSSKIYIDKDSGKARIRFRVEDVSKNHQGQDFKLQVGPDPQAKLFKDVAPDFTAEVNVRSKRNKRARSQSASGRVTSERRSMSPDSERARTGFHGHHDMAFERADLNTIRNSMKGVINWADEVVNGLYPLQWQVIGYAQHPDGSPDYTRPHHNMSNPNACISRILSTYSESVREKLRILLNSVENANPSRTDEQPYIPMAASIPREPDDPYGMIRNPTGQMHAQAGVLPSQTMNRRSGMLPSIASDTFRDKPLDRPPMQPFQARGQMPIPMHLPGQPIPGQQVPGHFMDGSMMQMHSNQLPQHRRMLPPPAATGHEIPIQRQLHDDVLDDSNIESEVAYVLAKEYKALRTGERLGFPAYNTNKEILGFYRESNGKVGVGSFHTLSRHRNDFGPLQVLQANEILENAIAKKSESVHALKDWGSMANLLDHALVYDWSKDIDNDPSASSSE